MAIFALLQAGCLEIDEEHCLANGGDLACSGQRCLMQTDADEETMSDEFGCSYVDEIPKYHFYLAYGLPADFGIGGGQANLDTVEGILMAWREEKGLSEPCKLGQSEEDDDLRAATAELVDVYVSRIYGFRGTLDDRIRVHTGTVGLYPPHRDAVYDYNEAMSNWLAACEAKAVLESSD